MKNPLSKLHLDYRKILGAAGRQETKILKEVIKKTSEHGCYTAALPMKYICVSLLLLLGLGIAEASAQDKKPEQDKKTDAKPEAAPAAEEKPSVTHHSITAHGKTLTYTATAGRLPIENEADHKAEAQMFYVSYVLDGQQNSGKRPVTFIFNGGPGSATIWLHMGCFGPRRVVLHPDGTMPAPPFRLEDNDNTILDRTDLVFIDAIGTGYSRATTPELGKKFWGVSGDIAAFGEFIRLYLQRNSRWTSPIYLAGESYGTTRAAGLSGYLVDHGVALNGVVLISTILNFQTLSFDIGNDLPYVLYLPTYATTAAYHHKLAPDVGGDMTKLQTEVEKFAAGEYASALQQGDALNAAGKEEVATKMARFSGLSKEYILRLNLRVDLSHFDTELLRQDDKIVGRLDGRFTGVNESGAEQEPDYDPSEAAIRPPYTAVFGDYVKKELGYQSDAVYYVLGGGVKSWDFSQAKHGWETGFADTSAALRKAFVKNPYMRLYVAEGLFDAATPYFAADYTLNHMGLPAAAHRNIVRGRFDAGHMVYIEQNSMNKLNHDMQTFYNAP